MRLNKPVEEKKQTAAEIDNEAVLRMVTSEKNQIASKRLLEPTASNQGQSIRKTSLSFDCRLDNHFTFGPSKTN